MVALNKFMRWTLPGLVTLTQLFMVFWLSDSNATLKFVAVVSKPSGFVAVLMAFVGSGAIGFIFAQLYFAVFDNTEWLMPDFRKFFQPHESKVRLLSDKPNSSQTLTKHKAWLLHVLYWHRLREEASDIKGIEPMTLGLVNTMHSLGATIVGTLLTAIFWGFCSIRLCIITRMSTHLKLWVISMLLLALIWLYSRGWKSVRRKLEVLVNSTMLNNLQWRSNAIAEGEQPIGLVYIESPWDDEETYTAR